MLNNREKEILIKNGFVKELKGDTVLFTDEFKEIFICDYKLGKKPKKIFQDCGFDYMVIGKTRIDNFRKAMKNKMLKDEPVSDQRVNNGYIDSKSSEFSKLSLESQVKRLQEEIVILNQINSVLKKNDLLEQRHLRESKMKKQQKKNFK